MSKDFYKYSLSKKLSSNKLDSYRNYMSSMIEDNGESIDIFSKLVSERIIFLSTDIDSEVSNIIKAQLLYLDNESSNDITILIDSPGGDIYSGLGLIDMFDWIKSDICTINVGFAASMSAILLACGEKGKRKAFKRSRTLIHQPLGWSGDSYRQATDIEIDAKEILLLKEELTQILSDRTSKSMKTIKEHMERDFFLSAKQSLDYGIIDKIIAKRDEL